MERNKAWRSRRKQQDKDQCQDAIDWDGDNDTVSRNKTNKCHIL